MKRLLTEVMNQATRRKRKVRSGWTVMDEIKIGLKIEDQARRYRD